MHLYVEASYRAFELHEPPRRRERVCLVPLDGLLRLLELIVDGSALGRGPECKHLTLRWVLGLVRLQDLRGKALQSSKPCRGTFLEREMETWGSAHLVVLLDHPEESVVELVDYLHYLQFGI